MQRPIVLLPLGQLRAAGLTLPDGGLGPAMHRPISLWPVGQPCAFAFSALKKTAPLKSASVTMMILLFSSLRVRAIYL
jgi:hypothetical protein